MTNEQLLDLLREAKRLIAANRLMLGHYSGVREVGSLEDHIDAALAEAQDSAKDVVEWRVMQDDPDFWEAYPADGETALDVTRCKDGRYRWSATVEREEVGYCDTEAEAKSAAIAAARGMR
jgi:hypothetical protein